MTGRLIIGTKRYSSWSLRGWLAVRLAGLEIDETTIRLAGGTTPELKPLSPSGLVPILEHNGACIWDSLAICEYCAELTPGLWPADRIERAAARSMAAEMHAGFRALRMALPMNLGRLATPPRAGIAPDAAADIARIAAIWHAAQSPFLFGSDFGAVDAMFAPVVTRCLSYDAVPDGAQAYCAAVRDHPLVARWYDEAAAEPESWRLPSTEQI